MQYTCAQCNASVAYTWWKPKEKAKCPHCRTLLFDSVRDELEAVYILSTIPFVIALVALRRLLVAFGLSVGLLIVAALCLAWWLVVCGIEIIICYKLRSAAGGARLERRYGSRRRNGR